MVSKEWVERNPFRMALIVSVFLSFCALLFHNFTVKSHEWGKVFMWIPLIWVIIYSISFLSYKSEKKIKQTFINK